MMKICSCVPDSYENYFWKTVCFCVCVYLCDAREIVESNSWHPCLAFCIWNKMENMYVQAVNRNWSQSHPLYSDLHYLPLMCLCWLVQECAVIPYFPPDWRALSRQMQGNSLMGLIRGTAPLNSHQSVTLNSHQSIKVNTTEQRTADSLAVIVQIDHLSLEIGFSTQWEECLR